MALFKSLKSGLYQVKLWFVQIFRYPSFSLPDTDYDKYWQDKRVRDVDTLSDWQKIRADFILRTIPQSERAVFVDIGCGYESVLRYLSDHTVVLRGIGIDVSSFALEHAKKFGFETVKADVTDPGFVDHIPACDYAVLFEVLEHIPHSEKLLLAVHRKARKGVFFSFPNTGFFVHRLRLLFGRFPLQWKLFPGEHLRFWTKKDLLWWLKSLGFKNYKLLCYKGMPPLNKIWPSLFAAGFVVYLKK
ncbi:class I SAM-dependent methyltransferase [Patescibacteria group bacterium]|nr:MAG: class I SAM-dependent methyltransferase [Patescibacteria group bacterium]